MIAKVNTKRIDFKNDLMSKRRLFALIGISTVLVLLSFWLTYIMRAPDSQNPVLSALTSSLTILLACLVVIFWVAWPGKKMDLKLENDILTYDYTGIPLEKVVSWALIDHGDNLEIILNKGGVGPEMAYFYAPQTELQNSGILDEFYKKVPYDQSLTEVNKIHSVLRKLGLR